MSTPYYADDRVTLHHGDALEVLRGLPDESIDAVCTDPPYGLSNTDPQHVADTIVRWVNGDREYLPPVKGGFMGQEWDAFVPPVAVWDECLRVLKPGGHVLAFAGSRTVDLMTLGLRLAGFDIRDSIAWLYGSGFPKSLDVSKAIDKLNGKPLDRLREFGAYVRTAREAAGLTQAEVNRAMGMPQGCGWWEGKGLGAKWDLHLPSRETWSKLKTVVPTLGTDWDAFIEWAEAERDVIGKDRNWGAASDSTPNAPNGEWDITAPATPDAERWQGWGTALKPAFEPVVVARKPLGGSVSIRSRVEYELRQRGVEGEIQWTTTEHANGAAKAATPTTSSATPARPAAATSAAPADESETPNDERPTANGSARRTPRGAQPTASTSAPTHAAGPQSSATRSSTHTATSAPAAGSESGCSSPSITSTEAAQPTGKRSDARSTSRSSAKDSPAVTESFAGIATGLIGSSPTVHIDRLADGTFVWPDGLPEVVTAGSTVASNVLQHGTGALNVDACRVESGGDYHGLNVTQGMSGDPSSYTGPRSEPSTFEPAAGRWPTNVVLDDSQAAALDEQSGERTSGKMMPTHTDAKREVFGQNASGGYTTMETYGDTGGASRFFPTFRYEAKAPATERPRVNGTAHPTVKPLDLMRWLVRLVTPPGGTVLEPFAGSGTTVEACIVEGFHCIAIEREADYLPLIMQRVNRRRDPVAYIKAAGDDLGLFDLEGLA